MTMDFKAFELFIFLFLTWYQKTLASTTYVGFNKKDCDVYRHYLYTEDDSYIVEWDGKPYPRFGSLRFNAMIYNYGLCAHVTRFQMDCSVDLKFYWGIEQDVKIYSCQHHLPIKYCDNDGYIFIELVPSSGDIKTTRSSLRIEVVATNMEDNGQSSSTSSSSGGIIAGIVIGLVIVIFFIVFCAIRYNRNNDNQEGAVIHRRDGGVHVTLANANQRYHPVPSQQYPPAGQQYAAYTPGQQYPMAGHPYPSAPPTEQQYPPGGQGNYIQNPNPGGVSSQNYTPEQHDSSAPPPSYNTAPPPSYSTVMGKG